MNCPNLPLVGLRVTTERYKMIENNTSLKIILKVNSRNESPTFKFMYSAIKMTVM